MNTVDFLRKILPDSGLYIAARLTGTRFRNTVCESIEELAQQCLAADAQGVHVYHACAAYREASVDGVKDGKPIKQTRTHANVRALKSFFMDLDVKPGVATAFQSQDEALDGLIAFCQTVKLPLPMIISSGVGIHIYWTLTHEIQPEPWKATADGLKQLASKHGFKADPACTADSARVLRPVGTWNRKGATPLAVECVADADPIEYATLAGRVRDACSVAGLKPVEAVRTVVQKTESINQNFSIKQSFPPCSGVKVAQRCAQLGKMRDTRGNISEPLWYAGIQLLCHSIEGDQLIHDWSNGHPGYNVDDTNRKIIQIRSQSLGPTLCSTFESREASGCEGCSFKGKISSPAQLGIHVVSAPAPTIASEVAGEIVQVVLPPPPEPFTRGENGGIYIEEDGITFKIHEYDAFPTELSWDEQLGYETMRWRHKTPNDGWKECVLQTSLLAKPSDFIAKLLDNHIHPLIKAKFLMYGDAYIRKIRSDTKLRRLFVAQGWKSDNTEFVLGDKLYQKDSVVHAGFSHGVSSFLSPFHTKGDLAPWRAMTSVFNEPAFAPHAFMMLLAFASPLFQLAGREGCTVCALGDTGIGKSTMAQVMCSVFANPKGTWVGRKDTELARMQRLGAHFNLPVYMDEATTIAPKELRDLVYSIPTGKNRSSMKADYTLRPGSEWCTLLVMTSNNSLQSKLLMENANAEAESLRLFEFGFPTVPEFGPIAKIIPSVIQNNYGVAGPAYIKYLVAHQAEIKLRLADLVDETNQSFEMADRERFWAQVAAFTRYGGELARAAGVIDFDPGVITPWLSKEIRRMRGSMEDNKVGAVAILANYLNEHVGERLVVTNLNANMTSMEQKVYRKITQRYDKDTGILWIDRKDIRDDMNKNHFDYQQTVDELIARGIVLSAALSKTLGAGTDYTGGQSICWKVDAKHAELEGVL